jgi:2-polyprenyl-6-hydroxyphenyl methylase/3-demethylubiquinone-9 3-methyltransferase
MAELVRPGGLIICSTLNRTAKSYALAIIGAEYILGWLPKGTHDWSKFITPENLNTLLESAGLTPVDLKGFVYNPIADTWRINADDLAVNYVAAAIRRD